MLLFVIQFAGLILRGFTVRPISVRFGEYLRLPLLITPQLRLQRSNLLFILFATQFPLRIREQYLLVHLEKVVIRVLDAFLLPVHHEQQGGDQEQTDCYARQSPALLTHFLLFYLPCYLQLGNLLVRFFQFIEKLHVPDTVKLADVVDGVRDRQEFALVIVGFPFVLILIIIGVDFQRLHIKLREIILPGKLVAQPQIMQDGILTPQQSVRLIKLLVGVTAIFRQMGIIGGFGKITHRFLILVLTRQNESPVKV